MPEAVALNFVTPSYAQTRAARRAAHGAPAAASMHEATEAHGGGEHGTFPPFDPATFGSQLFWLRDLLRRCSTS